MGVSLTSKLVGTLRSVRETISQAELGRGVTVLIHEHVANRFLMPPIVADHRNVPVNALGYVRVMFAVDDIDETLGRVRKRDKIDGAIEAERAGGKSLMAYSAILAGTGIGWAGRTWRR